MQLSSQQKQSSQKSTKHSVNSTRGGSAHQGTSSSSVGNCQPFMSQTRGTSKHSNRAPSEEVSLRVTEGSKVNI